MRITIAVAAASAALACAGCKVCVHGKNWPFKVGGDPQARGISLDPVPTTIDELRAIPHVDRPPDGTRIPPVELTTYVLRDVWLRSFQRSPDGDVHMVIADEHGHTMIIEAAPPTCTPDESPWRALIATTRERVDAEMPELSGWPKTYVSLTGVGYIDFLHGQPGVAPNAIELHPVLTICFGKGCALPAPRTPAPPPGPVACRSR
jgi:hypothetical protein